MNTDGSWAELGPGMYCAPVGTALPAIAGEEIADDFHVCAMAFGEAFIAVGEAAQQAAVKLSEATESLKPKIVSRPPMWANDPAHARRTAFGPTKRVK